MKFASVVLAGASASIASAAVSPLRRHTTRGNAPQRNPSQITATLNGLWFDVEVQVDGKPFYLLVDTGSSDTWVAKTGYQCISSVNNTELPQHDCGWSPTFDVPKDFEYVQNQTFGVQYGTGISLGKVGFANVTVGGITVPHQKVGIVESSNDKADGLNSGILGLGYPALTSAHYGTNNANDTVSLITNRAIYDPVFFNMHKNNLVDSWYSVALDRPKKNAKTSPGGWLGLGELPPVSHSDDWATVPIEITKNIPDLYYTNGKPEISLFALTVSSVTWGNSKASKSSLKTNSTSFQSVVDTGNAWNQVPAQIAAEVNAEFSPPAQFSKDLGIYLVECNATAPQFGVTIGKQTFWHEAVDLIQQDPSTGVCYSVIMPEAEGEGISLSFLGDAFLRNVVAVFDIGKDEMRFAARTEQTVTKPTPTSTATGSATGSATATGSAAPNGASPFSSADSWTLMVVLGLFAQILALM
ncbi:aspartic peptidase domain-containing protein [Mariannaea sp. PMI_226]|nr:aspartic peptidase domain-containing protein [Mariannaea sp. PMI_226]